MAKVFGESSALLSTTIRNVDYAKAVANGEANRRSGEYLQAEGTCGGHPGLTAGVKLNIDNIGDRFKGTYIVTSAMHVYDSQKKYHTQFTVSAMHSLTVMNLLASEPPPRVGLAIGIVTENNDPKGLGRVKVRYPVSRIQRSRRKTVTGRESSALVLVRSAVSSFCPKSTTRC